MLLGTICAISLFVIKPVARGDKTTAQTTEYESVFDSYDNWEWEETSDWLKASQNANEIGVNSFSSCQANASQGLIQKQKLWWCDTWIFGLFSRLS